MWLSFPREVGQFRKVVNNEAEFFTEVERLNRNQPVYTSVYSFETMRNNPNPESSRRVIPDYSSAIVDKIYFDLDPQIKMRDGTIIECDPYGDAQKIHKWCTDNNIRHIINFTGGGLAAFIFTKVTSLKFKASALENAQRLIANQLMVQMDPAIVGDLARITRVQNTYNIKRKRFCISLLEEDMHKSYDEVRELARSPRRVENQMMGDNLLDITPLDKSLMFERPKEEVITRTFSDADLDTLSEDVGWFPICVKRMLAEVNVKNRERMDVITFCRDMGLPIEFAHGVLQDHLSPDKYEHSMCGHLWGGKSELTYYYQRKDLLHASCESKDERGFCNNEQNCKFRGRIYR